MINLYLVILLPLQETTGLACLHALFCIVFIGLIIKQVDVPIMQPYISLLFHWGQQFHQIVWLCLTMLRYFHMLEHTYMHCILFALYNYVEKLLVYFTGITFWSI